MLCMKDKREWNCGKVATTSEGGALVVKLVSALRWKGTLIWIMCNVWYELKPTTPNGFKSQEFDLNQICRQKCMIRITGYKFEN